MVGASPPARGSTPAPRSTLGGYGYNVGLNVGLNPQLNLQTY